MKKAWSTGLRITIAFLGAFLLLIPAAYGTEVLIATTTPYYNGYYTSFTYQLGNNVFRSSDGTLHAALVANYELWYYKSTDGGATWSGAKIPSGHDGNVIAASLVVDHNGKGIHLI